MRRLLLPLLLLAVVLPMPSAWSQDVVQNPELEKTYRRLIRALYHEDMDVVVKIIHSDGFTGSDMNIPKADIVKELRNKNSDLRVALRRSVDEFQKGMCKKSGEVAVSPTAFYERYKEDYQVLITELVVDKYYQVVGQGVADKDGCRYLVSSYAFIKEGDDYYLISDITP